jgi:hypothetical protein
VEPARAPNRFHRSAFAFASAVAAEYKTAPRLRFMKSPLLFVRFVTKNQIVGSLCDRLRKIFCIFSYIFHSTAPFIIYFSYVWSIITVVSSVSLVFLLGLAVLFPLRVRITAEERPEHDRRIKSHRRKPVHRYRADYDEELYFDDDEL